MATDKDGFLILFNEISRLNVSIIALINDHGNRDSLNKG